MNMSDDNGTREQLMRNCQSVAETVERLTDGWRYCNVCGEYVKDDEHCDEETIDIYDYIADNLGIKLTTDLDGCLYGAVITVAWGGPNIYIDTNTKFVEGYWGLDSYRVMLSDRAIEVIDDQIEQMRY